MKPTKYQHIVRFKHEEPETPKFCLMYNTLGHFRTLWTPTTVQSPFFILFVWFWFCCCCCCVFLNCFDHICKTSNSWGHSIPLNPKVCLASKKATTSSFCCLTCASDIRFKCLYSTSLESSNVSVPRLSFFKLTDQGNTLLSAAPHLFHSNLFSTFILMNRFVL